MTILGDKVVKVINDTAADRKDAEIKEGFAGIPGVEQNPMDEYGATYEECMRQRKSGSPATFYFNGGWWVLEDLMTLYEDQGGAVH